MPNAYRNRPITQRVALGYQPARVNRSYQMAEDLNFHETFRVDDERKRAPTRRFGYLLALLFTTLGLLPLEHSDNIGVWQLVVAAAFFSLALFVPRSLAPLLWLWMETSHLLHRITNPILLVLIFYGGVMPTGIVLRALGKRPLQLKFEPDRLSYWTERNPPGPARARMKKQF